MMHISIIGPGRLGQSLGALFTEAGHTVSLVRDIRKEPFTDVRLITVPDRIIQEVAQALPKDRPTIHCSGTLEDSVLDGHAPYGRMHPLMTFPGPDIEMPKERPIFAAISGDSDGEKLCNDLANLIGFTPFPAPENLSAYHAAAVIAGNFSAILLREAAVILTQIGMDTDEATRRLLPLALQSLRNAAKDTQSGHSGPLTRGDHKTMSAHRTTIEALDLKKILRIYEVFESEFSKKH